MNNAQWKAECEDYLKAQGAYENRSRRYQEVRYHLYGMGYEGNGMQNDLIVDVGAGNCDFARYMYTHDEIFRYLPIDGSIDGVDIDAVGLTWSMPQADWYVCIETLEHLEHPDIVLEYMIKAATKGVVITTPNPERTDVLALDPTHKTPISSARLERKGFSVLRASIHYEEDTLVAHYRSNG